MRRRKKSDVLDDAGHMTKSAQRTTETLLETPPPKQSHIGRDADCSLTPKKRRLFRKTSASQLTPAMKKTPTQSDSQSAAVTKPDDKKEQESKELRRKRNARYYRNNKARAGLDKDAAKIDQSRSTAAGTDASTAAGTAASTAAGTAASTAAGTAASTAVTADGEAASIDRTETIAQRALRIALKIRERMDVVDQDLLGRKTPLRKTRLSW